MWNLAEIVKMIDIVKTVTQIMKDEFKCTVYSDEALENFKKPCFFIAAIPVSIPQTTNFMEKHLSIVLTYFQKDSMRNEVHYLDVFDRIQSHFALGMQVGDRFLHVDRVTPDRVGEEQDILQITIEIIYLEQTGKPESGAEMMEEIEVNGFNGDETVHDFIDKNS